MNAQRVLLTWGVVLIAIGMCFGGYLGPQVIPTRDVKEAYFAEAFHYLSAGNVQKAEDALKLGFKTENNFNLYVHALHSHALSLAFVALLFGLIQPFLGLSESRKKIFAWMLIGGTILYSIGLFIEPVNMIVGMSIVIIGVLFKIISAIAHVVGIVKYVSPESQTIEKG